MRMRHSLAFLHICKLISPFWPSIGSARTHICAVASSSQTACCKPQPFLSRALDNFPNLSLMRFYVPSCQYIYAPVQVPTRVFSHEFRFTSLRLATKVISFKLKPLVKQCVSHFIQYCPKMERVWCLQFVV